MVRFNTERLYLQIILMWKRKISGNCTTTCLIILTKNSQVKECLFRWKISQILCCCWFEGWTFSIVTMLKWDHSCSKLLRQNADIVIGYAIAWRFPTNFQKDGSIRHSEVVKKLIIPLLKLMVINWRVVIKRLVKPEFFSGQGAVAVGAAFREAVKQRTRCEIGMRCWEKQEKEKRGHESQFHHFHCFFLLSSLPVLLNRFAS